MLGMGNILKQPKDYPVEHGNNGDNVKHKQDELYKLPSELVCEILVSLVDDTN